MRTAKNRKIFKDIVESLAIEEKTLKKRSSMFATFRAISFFCGVALLLIGVCDKIFIAGVGGGLFLLAFVIMIKLHEIVLSKLNFIENKKIAATKYVDRYEDGWKAFEDTGEEFLKEDSILERDLDLFGRASLYQLINVCHTKEGKELLAKKINKYYEIKDQNKINEAVEELIEDYEGALSFEAYGMRNENKKKKISAGEFKKFCESEDNQKIPALMRFLSLLFPVLFLGLVVLSIFNVIHFGFAILMFIVNIGFSIMSGKYTDALIVPICYFSYSLDDYVEMLKQISGKKYKSELLKGLSKGIVGEKGILQSYNKLKGISALYNIIYNPLLYYILNGFLLWNYRLAHIARNWKNKYAPSAARCIDIIAEYENLRSLSVIGIVRDSEYANLKEAKDKVYISCKNIYHPMINVDTVVKNNADIKNGITVITGSNMSGKTTFLRTVAVNLILCYIGAPVCAESFVTNYMHIFTSMRAVDDVSHGISTFYAEILRIKTMAEYRKNNLPMICLIDEIFKGTNSADRIVGATEVIKGLSGENCIAMVSTHDFELCSIVDNDGNKAYNYHFEEYYEEDKLMFDYKIKDGRCTTTNAKAILRMAGFNV